MLNYRCVSYADLTLDELYAIIAARQDVFILEQECPYLDADGRDQHAMHLMGMDADGELMAYARLLPPGVPYVGASSFGRILTRESVRGTGEGKRMMQRVLAELERHYPGFPVRISAQAYLIPFYECFGFQSEGDKYLEDNIPHIAMQTQ